MRLDCRQRQMLRRLGKQIILLRRRIVLQTVLGKNHRKIKHPQSVIQLAFLPCFHIKHAADQIPCRQLGIAGFHFAFHILARSIDIVFYRPRH